MAMRVVRGQRPREAREDGSMNDHMPPPPSAPQPSGPLYEVTSKIDGRNATVTVWPDRIVLRKKKTFGIGGHDESVLPIKSISFVSKEKDGLTNHKVVFHASGNKIEARCSKSEANELASTVQQQMLR